jgi:hypothetical protein
MDIDASFHRQAITKVIAHCEIFSKNPHSTIGSKPGTTFAKSLPQPMTNDINAATIISKTSI